MHVLPHHEVLLELPAGQDRSRQLRYVICQAAGWSFFLVLQLVVTQLILPHKPDGPERVQEISITVMFFLLGWLLTDCARPLLVRWGWRELGWRALLPRILAMSAVQSLVLITVGYGYPFGVLVLSCVN